jgi:hypothetical protein
VHNTSPVMRRGRRSLARLAGQVDETGTTVAHRNSARVAGHALTSAENVTTPPPTACTRADNSRPYY